MVTAFSDIVYTPQIYVKRARSDRGTVRQLFPGSGGSVGYFSAKSLSKTSG